MINPNDPAFGIVRATNFEPIEGKPNAFRAVRWDVSSGLTKREWFAGLAMQGLISNPHPDFVKKGFKISASVCLDMADALIAALNTPQEGQEK